jgi:hypothetical protein
MVVRQAPQPALLSPESVDLAPVQPTALLGIAGGRVPLLSGPVALVGEVVALVSGPLACVGVVLGPTICSDGCSA